jgi:hypothetical protein
MSVGQFGRQAAGKLEYSALTLVRTRFETMLINAISRTKIPRTVFLSLRMMGLRMARRHAHDRNEREKRNGSDSVFSQRF